MKPVSGLELFDYLEILRKRFWIVFVCILVGLLGAGAVFLVTPKVYRSSALILVESQKVPTDLIKPVTADTIEERLISIQQQILSRTLLQKIIEEFNLYKNDLKSKPIEDVIDDMRKDIKVTIVDDRRMLHIQAFSLAYEGNNPRIVMQVTNKLASLFIQENLKVREQLVEGTSEFLEHELASVKEKLDLEEKQISEYKMKYMGQLPAQAEANLRTLDRLQQELSNIDETIRLTEEKRDIFRDLPTGAVASQPSSVAALLKQLHMKLSQLQSEFKDTYPDVMEMKRQIEELERRPPDETVKPEEIADPLVAAKSTPSEKEVAAERPRVANMNADPQIRALTAEIAARKNRKRELERSIKMFEQRVEATPLHEQQIGLLMRDYEQNRRNYENLMNKKIAANISETLEKRQKGEQFRIIDPGNFPGKPVKPDFLKVFLGGLVAGAGLAGGFIWWLDFRNIPFRRPEEVLAALDYPTLATIPFMSGLWGNDQKPPDSEPVMAQSRVMRCLAWPLRVIDRLRALTSASSVKPVVQANLNALAAEQFRVLAGRIIQLRDKQGVRILALSSSVAAEGKTTVAVGLAVTLARDYLEETILIDGDMRNPSVSSRMGLRNEKGLVNVLAGECDLDSVLYQHSHRNLKILTAGTNEGNGSLPVDRLGLPASRGEFQKLLESLRHRGVFVILDSPPILPMADMNLYAQVVDGIALVVRAGQTPQSVVVEALDFMEAGEITGVILNGITNMRRPYYSTYTSSRYVMTESPLLMYKPAASPLFPAADPKRKDKSMR